MHPNEVGDEVLNALPDRLLPAGVTGKRRPVASPQPVRAEHGLLDRVAGRVAGPYAQRYRAQVRYGMSVTAVAGRRHHAKGVNGHQDFASADKGGAAVFADGRLRRHSQCYGTK
ncbi:hypothetical protein GCM10022251_75180 [Phytohabitans flavus]|uniref:Uncharacterized protein n=1 Tax=Phytohabitans flavus TaxID=1076124 RepID=A0A6F8XLC3_9ACTN|nr:hypothetical protein Pflav_010340 [Phytohabitans flavus]